MRWERVKPDLERRRKLLGLLLSAEKAPIATVSMCSMGSCHVCYPDVALDWRKIRGLWVVRDCDVAALLGVTTRNLNRLTERRPDLYPERLAFRLHDHEFRRYYPICRIAERRGGRPPMVFSTAGVLQSCLEYRGKERLELVAWCVGSLVQDEAGRPSWAGVIVSPQERSAGTRR
ncbi:MAG: hypothetical protein EYC70_08245 [Planctomycetota bacterium]|nr:MAG: hypothetical protein EYC70_08245 [Planctomycetota bacterium]